MKKFQASFTISLSEVQKPVLDSIKMFIDSLGTNKDNLDLHIDRCSVNFRKARTSSDKPQYAIVISDLFFIYHYFLPFINNLIFLSKKELDYKD